MRKGQRGVTLIELMLAVALSLVVISAVVAMLSQLRNQARLLATEAELQENLSFAGNRLAFAFKSAFSSPCGDITTMLADGDKQSSSLKRAYYTNGGTVVPQSINGLLTAPSEQAFATSIQHQDFPMFSVGVVGDSNESVINGVPISEQLVNPKTASPYVVILEISERIVLNTDRVTGVRGGVSATPAGSTVNNPVITTSSLPDRLVGKRGVAFMITDCYQGDIFQSSNTVALTSHRIPVDDDLYFSGVANGYQDASTLIAPLSLYVYYLRESDADGIGGLARRNLVSGNDQILVAGVTDWQLSWGLSDGGQSVQTFFTTEQLINSGMSIADFRRYVVSVRSAMTVTGRDNRYRIFDDDEQWLSKRNQRVYTIRNKMQRR